MAEVTEKIDLTLDSLFAGDSNPALKPFKWRESGFQHPVFFFEDWARRIIGRHVSEIFPNLESEKFLREPEPDWTLGYWRIFKEFPSHAYEEVLGWGDPDMCAMCGSRTNIITRNDTHDSCAKCYNRELNKQMELTQ